jgi:homoserine O-succinyltransferase/O-acetyltransferase
LRDLRIGLLNLMPDAALAATDRQFLRLVSAYADEANLYIYPFTLAAGHRSENAQAYVSDNYSDFGELRSRGLDALILTGANPTHFELSDEPFWEGLIEVIDWADGAVHSTLCSCLATHAVLEHRGLVKRSKLTQKRWGVYQHGSVAANHPLLAGITTSIEAPHSHWFDMTAEELENVGLEVLVSSDEAGVHMATSDDGFRYVFFQGHPEYDDISLAKEYKREVARYLADEREYPDFPAHYFDDDAREILGVHRERVKVTHEIGEDSPEFPEEAILRNWNPTWSTQGQTIYFNWLDQVARRSRP